VLNFILKFWLGVWLKIKGGQSMPNLIMEYTQHVEDRLNTHGLLQDLHQILCDSGLFEICDVKSRAYRCHSWLIGDSEDSQDFIHITVDLLAGRTDEQKQALSQELIDHLHELAPWVASITVNIRNMDRSSFQKVSQT
jgi:5-carboxymethyl-2-hydroxymuconate isomerase